MSDGFDLGKACLEGNSRLVIRHLEGLREEDETLARKAVLQPDADKRTPLHWAASSGLSSEAIRLLCDCGGKDILEARDSSGWTALMIASSAGRAETVEQLLYAGADAIAANPRGQTSLHYAASKGHLDVAKVLLEQGPGGGDDVNARDGSKQCPLHRAATTGHDAIVRLLLSPPMAKNGAKREKTRVNPQDRLGNTPLHLAFDSGNGSTAIILIEEGGADRNRLNQDDQKPEEMPGTNEIEQRKVLEYVRSHVG